MNDNPGEVTTDALAVLLGVTSRTVTELGRRGVIPRGSRRGRWHVSQCVPAYCAHLREQAAGRAGVDDDGGPLDLATERAKLARAQRLKLDMDTARARGELVDAEGVRVRLSAMVTLARNQLLAVPGKAKAIMPALTVRDIETIEILIVETLESLANATINP